MCTTSIGQSVVDYILSNNINTTAYTDASVTKGISDHALLLTHVSFLCYDQYSQISLIVQLVDGASMRITYPPIPLYHQDTYLTIHTKLQSNHSPPQFTIRQLFLQFNRNDMSGQEVKLHNCIWRVLISGSNTAISIVLERSLMQLHLNIVMTMN